jgi:DNA-binding transcriptional LysR family regulator
MDLRQLRYFLALAEELHFGRAAERLYIAQPPLSRQIKNLEEELDVKLFNRTKRVVQLTSYGKYLKNEAVKLFQHVELIKNHIRLLNEGQVGQIKIGYVGSAMHSVLPEVLTQIQRKLPGTHTSMTELMNLDQIVGLKTGSLDIGFIRTPMTIDGLCIQRVFSETLSVILPLSHPLAGAEEVRPAHLAKEPFIGFCRECAPGLFDSIIGLCNRDGFSPRIVHESSQINSVVRLVESGLGYSIVPTSVKKAYNVRVRFHNLDAYPERSELALAYHPDHLTPTSRRVIEIVEAMKFDST